MEEEKEVQELQACAQTEEMRKDYKWSAKKTAQTGHTLPKHQAEMFPVYCHASCSNKHAESLSFKDSPGTTINMWKPQVMHASNELVSCYVMIREAAITDLQVWHCFSCPLSRREEEKKKSHYY